MKKLALASPAKVNFFLEVFGKRADGYHELVTVMAPLEFADQVRIERTASGVEVRCPHPGVPEGPANLAHRAASLFMARSGLAGGVRIEIDKRIPPGAGLGGGSSNAATVLSGMARLFEVDVPVETLRGWAAEIGSDCPFFIEPRPALCTGRGERIEPIPGPSRPLEVLLLVGTHHCATAEVYRAVPQFLRPPPAVRESLRSFFADDGRIASRCFNRLEEVVRRIRPEVCEPGDRARAKGCRWVFLTGSGSAHFVLDADPDRLATCGVEVVRTRVLEG